MINTREKFKPIFKKRTRRRKSNFRITIEAIIMMFIGINLAIFLNTLPGRFVFIQFISDTWNDFTKGFILLFESLINIGAVLIVIILLFSCLILIIGSLTRLILLMKRIYQSNSKRRFINK